MERSNNWILMLPVIIPSCTWLVRPIPLFPVLFPLETEIIADCAFKCYLGWDNTTRKRLFFFTLQVVSVGKPNFLGTILVLFYFSHCFFFNLYGWQRWQTLSSPMTMAVPGSPHSSLPLPQALLNDDHELHTVDVRSSGPRLRSTRLVADGSGVAMAHSRRSSPLPLLLLLLFHAARSTRLRSIVMVVEKAPS